MQDAIHFNPSGDGPVEDEAHPVFQGDECNVLIQALQECRPCGRRFDDPTDTISAGHHPPLRVRVLVLYLMGLNLSDERIAKGLDLDPDDARRMTTSLREGVVLQEP